MKRVFHRFERWEEHHFGMWRQVPVEERCKFIDAAAALMRDVPAFRAAMIRAVDEWPYSCEANFTAAPINHRAWAGHAGCCIATGSPEHLTRLGWHLLDDSEQDAANAAADQAIEYWRVKYEARSA